MSQPFLLPEFEILQNTGPNFYTHSLSSVFFATMEHMAIKDIANKIKQIHFATRPVIIAIDGFGGAGKSTLAKELKHELGSAYIVEADDFFLKDVKSDANKSNFDRERLKMQVLRPFRDGKTATYQTLERATDTLGGYVTVPATDYVIIEGVSTLHPDIISYMDYKVWLDIPADIAKERMIKRDKAQGLENGKLWEAWTESFEDYKELHHPEKTADLIVGYNFKLNEE
jgi:uridine kinase